MAVPNIYRETLEQPKDRIILAVDREPLDRMPTFMYQVSKHIGMIKAHSIALQPGWRETVNTIAQLGKYTMADPKFHDIPETVHDEVKEVTECGAKFITVHASGTVAMLKQAIVGRNAGRTYLQTSEAEATNRFETNHMLGGILGVTVLTSINDECYSIYGDSPEKKVVQFAYDALEADIDGIVCSPKELRAIRTVSAFDNLITVVPGIVPEWANQPSDQKRVATPTQAIQDGADFLVIGRAIMEPPAGISRTKAAALIEAEVIAAL